MIASPPQFAIAVRVEPQHPQQHHRRRPGRLADLRRQAGALSPVDPVTSVSWCLIAGRTRHHAAGDAERRRHAGASHGDAGRGGWHGQQQRQVADRLQASQGRTWSARSIARRKRRLRMVHAAECVPVSVCCPTCRAVRMHLPLLLHGYRPDPPARAACTLAEQLAIASCRINLPNTINKST